MKSRIMYIEQKGDGISGPARIGRLTYSKSGQSLSYQGEDSKALWQWIQGDYSTGRL